MSAPKPNSNQVEHFVLPLDNVTSIANTACFKKSYGTGMVAGALVGAHKLWMTRKPYVASLWAVGGTLLVGTLTWYPCRFRHYTQKTALLQFEEQHTFPATQEMGAELQKHNLAYEKKKAELDAIDVEIAKDEARRAKERK